MYRTYELIDPYTGDFSTDFESLESAIEYYESRIKEYPNAPIALVEVLSEYNGIPKV
jgi:hypothetical protein